MSGTEYKLKLYRGKWAVKWIADGKTQRCSTGTTDREAADRFLIDFVARREKPEIVTVGFLWTKYCAEKDGKPAVKRMNSEWKALQPVFGHLRPDDIYHEICGEYTAGRRATGIKDGTIWTELGDLATVLAWSVKRKLLTSAPYIERPQKPPPKERFLRENEIRALIDAAHLPHVRLAIILMLGTAGRVGAVLDLTWDRVDFEHGIISLAVFDGQRRKGRATVPMNAMTRPALLEAHKGALTDNVIEWAGRPVKSVKRGFAKAVEIADLKDVTPNVLRHTAAVHMAKRGIAMSKIAQYLGHEDDKITQRVYARFAPDFMQDAAEALEFIKVG